MPRRPKGIFDDEIIDPTCRECGCSYVGNPQDYNITWICGKCIQRKADEPAKTPLDTSKAQSELVKQHIQNIAEQRKEKRLAEKIAKNQKNVHPQHELASSDLEEDTTDNNNKKKKKKKKKPQFACPPPFKREMRKKSDNRFPFDEAVKSDRETREQPTTNERAQATDDRPSGYMTSHTRSMCSQRR